MSAFERHAIGRLVEQAASVGVDVPADIMRLVDGCMVGSAGARAWAAAHPDDDRAGCCWSSIHDPSRCICWVPVYDVVQAEPRPPTGPQDLQIAPAVCGDCAYRKGSPERSCEWQEEALLQLASSGEPFWCHQGMRRPAYYRHPDGRTVPGNPDDWQPPTVGGIPYRLDGAPGLLCAGWAVRASRVAVAADRCGDSQDLARP